ncbi:6474_t:CDS:2 [Racocetra fulgida]|uniref:6474_t:CDS:1 n=1 Tax=Racocetra fulgida TaxID=60492 RepID=A0A9N9AU48_9GLOM|nr:6474_t:CDS:2 [Racocetra fulgida]
MIELNMAVDGYRIILDNDLDEWSDVEAVEETNESGQGGETSTRQNSSKSVKVDVEYQNELRKIILSIQNDLSISQDEKAKKVQVTNIYNIDNESVDDLKPTYTVSVKLARYYCDKCKFWDDHPLRDIYHCDHCGICRKGRGLGYNTKVLEIKSGLPENNPPKSEGSSSSTVNSGSSNSSQAQQSSVTEVTGMIQRGEGSSDREYVTEHQTRNPMNSIESNNDA